MSFNMTNVTGLTSSPSYHLAHGNVSVQRFSISADTANNLGYGVGRIIRGAFDGLWNTWQKMTSPEPSALEIAEQRNYMIYEGGLRECVKLLGPALAKLQRDPKNLGRLKQVEQLAVHFARYLEPSNEENLRELQSKILKPLEERVSATAHLNIKNALSKWMPVFFQGNNPMSEKTQTELQLAYARRSQVMQEFSGAKAKPLQENDFEITDPAGTDNGYYYSDQLNDVRNCLNFIDARLSKLFTIFPGVLAEPVEPIENEVAVLAKDDQNLETARADTAFIAYITRYNPLLDEGKVIAIDTNSHKVVANVTVGKTPNAIAITPNSHYAYVVNSGSNTVSVIDTYSNIVVANVSVGNHPTNIAITPDGFYAYVVNAGNNSISVINTTSKAVIATFGLGKNIYPVAVAITPNGLYAYVTCFNNNRVIVINTTNYTNLKTIDVNRWPKGIAITPDGLYAYVANWGSGTISVINTTSDAVIITRPLESLPNDVAITPNGLYAYVTCFNNNRVIVINTTNYTNLKTIDVGKSPLGIAITPDGLYAYVANSGNSTISVINTTSYAVIATINIDDSSYAIAITPSKIPIPTSAPTGAPTSTPTGAPSQMPTGVPTSAPTNAPSHMPTGVPTSAPTDVPTEVPTSIPTSAPSYMPTSAPTTGNNAGLIVGLSCAGGGLIILLGVGGYFTARWLMKEEEERPEVAHSLINPLSTEQKMIFM